MGTLAQKHPACARERRCAACAHRTAAGARVPVGPTAEAFRLSASARRGTSAPGTARARVWGGGRPTMLPLAAAWCRTKGARATSWRPEWPSAAPGVGLFFRSVGPCGAGWPRLYCCCTVKWANGLRGSPNRRRGGRAWPRPANLAYFLPAPGLACPLPRINLFR